MKVEMGPEDSKQSEKDEISSQEIENNPETEKCRCGEYFAMPNDIVEILHCADYHQGQCFECYEKQMGTQQFDAELTDLLYKYCDTGENSYLKQFRKMARMEGKDEK